MPLVKTEGIILLARPFSESSKILVVYTRDQGRVSILVKGGRKGTKKFPGGLETLNRVELQYYHRGGRELQTFKSFDLIESYSSLHSDLQRTYTALSLAEIVLKATASEDDNPDLYRDLTAAFTSLDKQDLHPWAYRWKALLDVCRDLGFGITPESCSRCGNRSSMIGFDLAIGGFVCHKHQLSDANVIPTSGEIWGVLRFLNQCPEGVAHRTFVKYASGRQIEALFLQYFRYHVSGLKSLDSWKKLPEIYWGEEEVTPWKR